MGVISTHFFPTDLNFDTKNSDFFTLGMEKKYTSSTNTNMEINPTWTHVACHPAAVSILFKLA